MSTRKEPRIDDEIKIVMIYYDHDFNYTQMNQFVQPLRVINNEIQCSLYVTLQDVSMWFDTVQDYNIAI